MSTNNPDVLIIGGGIAGASAAASLGQSNLNVVLVDMENLFGYHTTGRSAATFVGCYGNPIIRTLSAASRPFFISPPEGFSEYPLLSPRGALFVADEQHITDLEKNIADPINFGLLERLDTAAALKLSPTVRPEAAVLASFEADAADIDVNALLQGYLKQLRNSGCQVLTRAGVTRLTHRGSTWEVETRAGMFSTPVVVNAAGAWADEIATLAGCRSIGLVPKRRTALTFDPGLEVSNWPLTISVDETWDFRPEGGDLLLSPADETPFKPCDVQPDELDVALCVDRIQRFTTMEVESLVSKRAGLRSFVFDKSPVVGFAEDADGFFWLAGQGGYGIQTAPAIAEFTAGLILQGAVPVTLTAHGITMDTLSPARFRL